jgi:heat shock protein HslJ
MRTLPLLLLLAACASTAPEKPMAATPPSPEALAGATWRITEIAGTPVPAGAEVTMEFKDGRIAGKGACNRYFGSFEAGAGTLKLGPAGSTMMACPDPLMQTEQAFHAALKQVTGFKVEGNSLTLSGPDGPLMKGSR